MASGQLEAAVEKCRERRGSGTGPHLRSGGSRPGIVTQGASRLEMSLPLALGPQILSLFFSAQTKGPGRLCDGKGKGASHDRWVALKTLIAAFCGGSGFPSYLAVIPTSKPPLPHCIPATQGWVGRRKQRRKEQPGSGKLWRTQLRGTTHHFRSIAAF